MPCSQLIRRGFFGGIRGRGWSWRSYGQTWTTFVNPILKFDGSVIPNAEIHPREIVCYVRTRNIFEKTDDMAIGLFKGNPEDRVEG